MYPIVMVGYTYGMDIDEIHQMVAGMELAE